jgi:hypothetical protein
MTPQVPNQEPEKQKPLSKLVGLYKIAESKAVEKAVQEASKTGGETQQSP